MNKTPGYCGNYAPLSSQKTLGNVIRIDSLNLLDSTGTYLIPVERKPEILALRQFIRETFPNPVQEDDIERL
ncbi:hypothetical protein LptCag_0029 [Leptospirillum ferriphilum]|uniref:Uncharacterized protein n=1 Tax=Leptospirillum ferriphilum TaxID=178606 RepID=A0A094YJN0_9BACT|nr:hypothetical protein [Leptospirillum ferriphilum]KGA93416.1 hypothetical protein LptCag_0029 [Leptospirillum ferriphilum]